MSENAATIFEEHRPFLTKLASRITSNWSDAEEMVAQAFLRWQNVPIENVENPRAFLATIVTRLALNYKSSARIPPRSRRRAGEANGTPGIRRRRYCGICRRACRRIRNRSQPPVAARTSRLSPARSISVGICRDQRVAGRKRSELPANLQTFTRQASLLGSAFQDERSRLRVGVGTFSRRFPRWQPG